MPVAKKRCPWGGDALLISYHDNEWGTPVHDDALLLEHLSLDCMQAGLSWLTILRKREAFREAFDGFDQRKVARYKAEKVESLLQDQGIVRNRQKIEAAINNAQRLLEVQKEQGSFDAFIWSFVEGRTIITRPPTTGPSGNSLIGSRHTDQPCITIKYWSLISVHSTRSLSRGGFAKARSIPRYSRSMLPWQRSALSTPKGIILSGGPSSVYDKGAPAPDMAVFKLGIPVLGICYGMQLMAHHLAGKVARSSKREYGSAELIVDDDADFLWGISQKSKVWMSHGDRIEKLPKGFAVIAHTANSPVAGNG